MKCVWILFGIFVAAQISECCGGYYNFKARGGKTSYARKGAQAVTYNKKGYGYGYGKRGSYGGSKGGVNQCRPGYHGPNCQHKIKGYFSGEKKKGPEINQCRPGYHGPNCQHKIKGYFSGEVDGATCPERLEKCMGTLDRVKTVWRKKWAAWKQYKKNYSVGYQKSNYSASVLDDEMLKRKRCLMKLIAGLQKRLVSMDAKIDRLFQFINRKCSKRGGFDVTELLLKKFSPLIDVAEAQVRQFIASNPSWLSTGLKWLESVDFEGALKDILDLMEKFHQQVHDHDHDDEPYGGGRGGGCMFAKVIRGVASMFGGHHRAGPRRSWGRRMGMATANVEPADLGDDSGNDEFDYDGDYEDSGDDGDDHGHDHDDDDFDDHDDGGDDDDIMEDSDDDMGDDGDDDEETSEADAETEVEVDTSKAIDDVTTADNDVTDADGDAEVEMDGDNVSITRR